MKTHEETTEGLKITGKGKLRRLNQRRRDDTAVLR